MKMTTIDDNDDDNDDDDDDDYVEVDVAVDFDGIYPLFSSLFFSCDGQTADGQTADGQTPDGQTNRLIEMRGRI